jgi:hypothetical protein
MVRAPIRIREGVAPQLPGCGEQARYHGVQLVGKPPRPGDMVCPMKIGDGGQLADEDVGGAGQSSVVTPAQMAGILAFRATEQPGISKFACFTVAHSLSKRDRMSLH